MPTIPARSPNINPRCGRAPSGKARLRAWCRSRARGGCSRRAGTPAQASGAPPKPRASRTDRVAARTGRRRSARGRVRLQPEGLGAAPARNAAVRRPAARQLSAWLRSSAPAAADRSFVAKGGVTSAGQTTKVVVRDRRCSADRPKDEAFTSGIRLPRASSFDVLLTPATPTTISSKRFSFSRVRRSDHP
jgi:hypothetical protein